MMSDDTIHLVVGGGCVIVGLVCGLALGWYIWMRF